MQFRKKLQEKFAKNFFSLGKIFRFKKFYKYFILEANLTIHEKIN